jgi:hypothetical protein
MILPLTGISFKSCISAKTKAIIVNSPQNPTGKSGIKVTGINYTA